MKKNWMLSVFLIIVMALVIFGCKELEEFLPDIIDKDNDWLEGIQEFEVKSAGTGKVTYSFGHSSPPAKEYVMYYIEGHDADPDDIIKNGTKVEVERAKRHGTIDNLNNETTYSFVVVASSEGYKDLYSDVVMASVGYTHWVKEFTDFAIGLGSFGEITYSFAATDPVADTYTMYYLIGDDDSTEIINKGNSEKVSPADNTDPKTLKHQFETNKTYSFVIVAEYEGISGVLHSHVRTIKTEYGWGREIEDLAIDAGENSDELKYSFTATHPNADTYTLYYTEGKLETADEIIKNAGENKVTIKNYDESLKLSGDILNIKEYTVYSFVVVAEYGGFQDSVSNIVYAATAYTEWVEGITDLTIKHTVFGEFTYSFKATTPAAESYTLHYFEGSTEDANQVINNGTSVKVEGLSGTVRGLKPKADYSIVVAAKYKDFEVLKSPVESVNVDWISGITNFEVGESEEVVGDLTYSFTETNPKAESYTLYYSNLITTEPSVLIEYGDSKTISASSGKISLGLGDYYVILVAKYEGLDDLISEVKQVNFASEGELSVTAGVNTNGELTYSFKPIPGAKGYSIYYLQTSSNDASNVIENGTKVEGITASATSKVIPDGKKKGGQYRIVVVAETNADDVISNVANAEIKWVTTAAQLNTNFVHSFNGDDVMMNYSFDHTNPVADSYWIYYLNNNTNSNSAAVVSNASTVKVEVTPTKTGKIRLPAGNNRVILVARYDGIADLVDGTAANTNFVWTTAASATIFGTPTASATTFKEVSYTLTASNPAAGTYALYYLKSTASETAAQIIAHASAVQKNITPTAGVIDDLEAGTYRMVVVLKKDGLADLTLTTIRTVNTIAAAQPVITQISSLPAVISLRSHANSVAAARVEYDKLTSDLKSCVTNSDKLFDAEAQVTELEKPAKFNAVLKETKDIDGFTGSVFNSANSFALDAGMANGFGEVLESAAFDVLVEYTFKGLEVVGGKLTSTVFTPIEETKALTKNNNGLFVLDFGSKLGQASGKITLVCGEVTVEFPFTTLDIERRLYNIAVNRAKDYGAVEMFSYGNAPAATGGPTTRARGNTIVNYSNGKGVSSYFSTFSRGDGGLMGSGDATNVREVYYDGEYMYGRTQGGNTNLVDGTNVDTAVVLPSSSQGWATTTSVNSSHTSIWTAFVNNMKSNPFGYIPYDVQNAFTGYYNYQYVDSGTSMGNGDNPTAGRTNSPAGISGLDTTSGRLAYTNGTFQFTANMDGNKANNRVNIEWAGNVTTTGYTRCYITFVIDADMKFVKYHAFDRYPVSAVISVSTNVYATQYFMYHKDNINYNSHTTYRGHKLRVNANNYCDCTDCNAHVTSGDNAVISGSGYAINLGWTANTNAASKVAVPKP